MITTNRPKNAPEIEHREPSVDEIAFRKMKPEIDANYPKGHFLAFENGRVIADAPTYEALSDKIDKVSANPRQAMVVRAGGYYPEFAWILAAGGRS